ncbi:MAG TPA: class I SAM-dependent methyltransferase [Sedimentisphaerales bacterium]|nr:class I SAM-dependent methyltransferase [Sedimentisphaerales bacterium]
MRKLLITVAPKPFGKLLKAISINAKKIKYCITSCSCKCSETAKAKPLREKESFFLLDRDDTPDTIGEISFIKKACPNNNVIHSKVCSSGHTITKHLVQNDGEYSIEIVLQKLSSESIIAKDEEANKFYDHYSQDKSTKLGKWLKTCLARQIFKFAQIEEWSSILEIGPGRGDFADICLRKGVDYCAIESNDKMANDLEKKGVKVLRNIVPPIPETGRSFDIVVMSHVMEHMDTMTKALELSREIHKLLNPGGRFVICSPDYINWRHHFFYNDFSHNYVTTLKRLRGLLISAGFENIEAKYQSGPFMGIMCLVVSAMASWLPFDDLNAIFPQTRWLHKLSKLQVTFLRGVLIFGEKIN